MRADEGRLTADVEGEIETQEGVLVIRRIRVRYRLELEPGDGREAAARRVHEMHHARCPVYRTISGCVSVSTELELVEAEAAG